ncbi:MAG: HAMP domain-containing sensor histidine kinase [bacterium]|nr:HAMP domain-containing sensor histidine kinase [bacterium]
MAILDTRITLLSPETLRLVALFHGLTATLEPGGGPVHFLESLGEWLECSFLGIWQPSDSPGAWVLTASCGTKVVPSRVWPCDEPHPMPVTVATDAGSELHLPLVSGPRRLGMLVLVRAPGIPPFSPGVVPLVSALATPLSNLLDHERLLTSEARRMAEVERLKDAFLATVSHELKTPLTTLTGFLELLLHRSLPPGEQREVHEVLLTETRRLGRLVHDLLDLSRIRADRMILHPRRNRVAGLLERAIAPFRLRHSMTHDLTVHVEPARGMWTVDPDRITQVVVNLVGNALQATPAGGRIDIRGVRSGSGWRCSIEDDGPGIPAGHLERVFERFHRVDEHQNEGTGLGLAIAREIVERHGGTMGLESTEGRGTTVSFSIPGIRKGGQAKGENPGMIA